MGLAPQADDSERGWASELGVKVGELERIDCPAGQLLVPGGPFLMGSESGEAGRDERPVHVVTVSAFCLDETEATRDGAALHPLGFDEAVAHCASRGFRLPTEAQWEKAARGGCELGTDPDHCDANDLRKHPWGDEVANCERANHQLVGAGGPKPCVGSPGRVGQHPAGNGPYGHKDMAGGVWEWVSDAYHPATYHRDPLRVDPLGPSQGDIHVLRGGAWDTFSTNMRVANRFTSLLEGSVTGVRCASGGRQGAHDPVDPYPTFPVKLVVQGMKERSLIVSAFDVRDLDGDSARPLPGRSPVVEMVTTADKSAGGPNSCPELPCTSALDVFLPEGDFLMMVVAMPAGQGIRAPLGSPQIGQVRVRVAKPGVDAGTISLR